MSGSARQQVAMHAPSATMVRLSQHPRAYVADGFASSREINHVLSRYGGHAAPTDLGIAWDHGIAGRSGELPLANDPVLAALATRIEALLGFGSALAGGTFRFRRYAPGDLHPGHLDCYQIAGLHLVATAIVYLTDASAGGATVFPEAKPAPLSIAARRGRLALWFNYTPEGAVDRHSFHASDVLLRGEKVNLAYFVYAPIALAAREPGWIGALNGSTGARAHADDCRSN